VTYHTVSSGIEDVTAMMGYTPTNTASDEAKKIDYKLQHTLCVV